MLNKLFKLNEKNTTIKTEVIAGITTFLSAAYILAVNPNILADAGMNPSAVFLATALSAAIGSIIMGLLANYPITLAPGMGVNALFTYTVCLTMGYSWSAALAAVLISGIIFVLISATGIRKKIIDAIPVQLKLAIGAGIGFFIAFIGFKNSGIIVSNPATFVGLGDFTQPTVLLAVVGLILTIIFVVKKVPAAVFVGMIVTAILGIVLGMFGVSGMPQLPTSMTLQLDFSAMGSCFSGISELFAKPFNAVMIIFSFLFVDFFDTAGTLVAIGNRIGLVKENGEVENVEKALLADSIGTVFGAIMGTSTVTSVSESLAGVGVGGCTGLSACTSGILFILSIFISPLILSVITNAVTAPALIIVGVMMAQQLAGIEWDDMVSSVAAFVTILSMILTYSISNGIAFGFIAYTVAMIGANKTKEVHPTVWALMIIFVLYFAAPYFI